MFCRTLFKHFFLTFDMTLMELYSAYTTYAAEHGEVNALTPSRSLLFHSLRSFSRRLQAADSSG